MEFIKDPSAQKRSLKSLGSIKSLKDINEYNSQLTEMGYSKKMIKKIKNFDKNN